MLLKKKRTDLRWLVYTRGRRVFVEPAGGTYTKQLGLMVRALTARAAARRFIRGNLDHQVACRVLELDNLFRPGDDMPSEIFASPMWRDRIHDWTVGQYGHCPIVVGHTTPPEPAADPAPRREWRRRGWKRAKARS